MKHRRDDDQPQPDSPVELVTSTTNADPAPDDSTAVTPQTGDPYLDSLLSEIDVVFDQAPAVTAAALMEQEREREKEQVRSVRSWPWRADVRMNLVQLASVVVLSAATAASFISLPWAAGVVSVLALIGVLATIARTSLPSHQQGIRTQLHHVWQWLRRLSTRPTVGLDTIRSAIPARVDRLPWSRFHRRMIVALGVCWILDGFEITVAAGIAPQLTDPAKLGLSAGAVSFLATIYLIGQLVGALVFGQMSDRFGRRRLFFWTLAIYFLGSALSAVAFGSGAESVAFLYLARFIAGFGIGGEYAAINSMIDEMIPAEYRGRVDVMVNGTYWAGAAFAGVAQYLLLSGSLDSGWAWRIALLIGPLLAVVIIALRRSVPESPRWQVVHGRQDEAAATIAAIEAEVIKTGKTVPDADDDSRALAIRPVLRAGYLPLLRVLFRLYPRRSLLGATLMITQSFLYNAIFFSYIGVLVNYFHLDGDIAPLYLVPFAIANLIGALLLAPLFDKLGRRPMIAGTYLLSGFLLFINAYLYSLGVLGDGAAGAAIQTLIWCVIFFFASAGASSAYLTVSEIFPIEVRAKSIAVFFAIAQGFGAIATAFYGNLVNQDNPEPGDLVTGYNVGAVFMAVGGLVALMLAVRAEKKSLEDVAAPLSAVEENVSTAGLRTWAAGE